MFVNCSDPVQVIANEIANRAKRRTKKFMEYFIVLLSQIYLFYGINLQIFKT
jgi:hypothetical protein